MSSTIIATSTSTGVGVRRSVRALQEAYDAGDKAPLEALVRAWKAIEDLPPTDPRSFFVLGGYHGEPFLARPAVDALSEEDTYAYWGGYCNHGNVLFPTWHRVYVRKLEEALQSFEPSVMMPFWDETSEETLGQGIPEALTDETFTFSDGTTVKNPLRSFVLPERMQDDYWGDNQAGVVTPYFKPLGYETVRYPLSGLVGSYEARNATDAHNAAFPDADQNTDLLNDNVRAWLLGGDPTPKDPDPTGTGVFAAYAACLDAPNYTAFSNTTSAAAWNDAHKRGHVVALESPHNDVHLAVGGFDLPALGGPGSTTGQVEGSNGDMGENNTAALDPIFFFHHCNVDRMFWLWQQRKGHSIEILEHLAGANSNDSQGPTPGIKPGTALTVDTPLHPFKKADGTPYTSTDCVDTEAMGYTYGEGSVPEAPPLPADGSAKTLVVRGLNRLHLKGSFVIAAWAAVDGEDGADEVRYLGHESVLSRWNVEGCANCQTHLDVVARFPLRPLTDAEVEAAQFQVEVTHRGTDLPDNVRLRLTVES